MRGTVLGFAGRADALRYLYGSDCDGRGLAVYRKVFVVVGC